jgi:hypothetical protein
MLCHKRFSLAAAGRGSPLFFGRGFGHRPGTAEGAPLIIGRDFGHKPEMGEGSRWGISGFPPQLSKCPPLHSLVGRQGASLHS